MTTTTVKKGRSHGRKGLYAGMLVCLVAISLCARQQAQTADKVVRKIDELYKSTSSTALMEMEIVTPHWQRTLRMKEWTKGMEKVLVKILAPKKERNVGTLKIGTEMWNYLPNTNKVIKVPPSMMMSSWMGSDFTNDDLVKEYTFYEDYDFSLFRPEDAVDSLYYVKCIPREGRPIVWGKVVAGVRKKDYMPVFLRYFDEDGTVVRLWRFENIRTFDGRTIPAKITVIPQDEDGNKTIVRYLEADFDTRIDDDMFSLRSLRAPVSSLSQ